MNRPAVSGYLEEQYPDTEFDISFKEFDKVRERYVYACTTETGTYLVTSKRFSVREDGYYRDFVCSKELSESAGQVLEDALISCWTEAEDSMIVPEVSIAIPDTKENQAATPEELLLQYGNTVKLTIDSDYQRNVQTILENHITWLRNQTLPDAAGTDANAGAIVVLNAKTGALLAAATAPTYNLNDYIADYAAVAGGENSPLTNRATNARYRPGSTFKTVTATAALNEGIISPYTEIDNVLGIGVADKVKTSILFSIF